MSMARIWAMVLRHLYVYRRSVVRLAEVVFWPMMDLLVWGFVTQYLNQFDVPKSIVFLIGAMIFWDVLFRAQQAVTVSILQEMWVGNIINIFVTPIRTFELVSATCVVGAIRAFVTATLIGFLAYLLYAFNLLNFGIMLLPYFMLLLLFGWSIGIVTTAIILRYGQAAEGLAWAVPFLVQPLSAVFYPVAVLPGWLQPIAWCIPSTYVFEGMRTTLATGRIDWWLLGASLTINIVYLIIAGAFLRWMLDYIRVKGYLTRGGRE